jgi:hypothetical protein
MSLEIGLRILSLHVHLRILWVLLLWAVGMFRLSASPSLAPSVSLSPVPMLAPTTAQTLRWPRELIFLMLLQNCERNAPETLASIGRV